MNPAARRPGRPAVGVDYVSLPPGDGYGEAALGYLHALRHLGIPVSWRPQAWKGAALAVHELPAEVAAGPLGAWVDAPLATDTLVVHMPPPELARAVAASRAGRPPGSPYRRVVGVTTTETETFPPHWVDHLRGLDVVVVPSTFNAEALRRAAPELSVVVVPHVPVDDAPDEPRDEPSDEVRHHEELGDRFVFYSIGPWTTRKDLGACVTAFLDAFSAADDVALVVKTSQVDYQAAARPADRLRQHETWWTLAHLLAHRPAAPPVLLVTEPQAASEIRALHRRGDCLVSLNRGEGFGLTIFDAVLAGNPVVVTGWGGPLDYLSPTYPLLVPSRLITLADDQRDTWHAPSALRWAQADRDRAVEQLRWVSDHRDEARRLAARVQARTRADFGLEAVAPRLADALVAGD